MINEKVCTCLICVESFFFTTFLLDISYWTSMSLFYTSMTYILCIGQWSLVEQLTSFLTWQWVYLLKPPWIYTKWNGTYFVYWSPVEQLSKWEYSRCGLEMLILLEPYCPHFVQCYSGNMQVPSSISILCWIDYFFILRLFTFFFGCSSLINIYLFHFLKYTQIDIYFLSGSLNWSILLDYRWSK